jgi:hypothetical protein
MESGSFIFILVIVLVIVVLIVVSNINKKKKEKQLLSALKVMAGKNNDIISEFDLWNSSRIGIDKTTQRLFFIRNTETEEVSKVVDLPEILRGKVVNISKSINYKGSSQAVVERIELVLTNRDKNKPDVILEFYNSSSDNPILRNEILLAEKWAGIVNGLVAGGNK